MGYSPWGHKESDTTERLILLHFVSQSFPTNTSEVVAFPSKMNLSYKGVF